MTATPSVYSPSAIAPTVATAIKKFSSKGCFVPRYKDTDNVLVASALLSRDGFKVNHSGTGINQIGHETGGCGGDDNYLFMVRYVI